MNVTHTRPAYVDPPTRTDVDPLATVASRLPSHAARLDPFSRAAAREAASHALAEHVTQSA